MLKRYFYTAALALSCQSSLIAYDKDLETLYPEDTLLYGKVESISKLTKIDAAHPVAKLFKNTAFKQYFGTTFIGEIAEDIAMENGGKTVEQKQREQERKMKIDEIKKEAMTFIKKHALNRASFGILKFGAGKMNVNKKKKEATVAWVSKVM